MSQISCTFGNFGYSVSATKETGDYSKKSVGPVFLATDNQKFLRLGSYHTHGQDICIYANIVCSMPVAMRIIVTEMPLQGEFINEFVDPIHTIRALDYARRKWLECNSLLMTGASELVAAVTLCFRTEICRQRISDIRRSIAARTCQRIWLALYYSPNYGVGMLKRADHFQRIMTHEDSSRLMKKYQESS